MSGFFHFLPLNSSSRGIFQRLDHAAIFVLIAGTFTPIHLIRFRGFWRWGPLSLIWAVAIVGVVIKTAFFKDMSESISLLTYLSMGWFGIVTAVLLWLESGFLLVRPLLAGAVSYSVGSISEFFKQPVLIDGVIGPHELFHLTVLIGIAFHWHLIRHILTADCKLASSEARVLEENALGV
jgi:channel protein (hemolysin III family)